jgi:soluble lytic murein transglycosylase-like protein
MRRSLGQSYTTAQIQQMITAAANQYGVPASLALAVAQVESNFNPNAVNTSNKNGTSDYGVFQINSSNLSSLGLTDPLDPTQNINAGVSLLASLYNQYGGDATQTLWAYNAGPTSVASGNMPTSTQSYIPSVLNAEANYGTSVPDLTGTSLDSSVLPSGSSSTGTSFFTSDLSIAGVDVPGYALVAGAGLVLLGLWVALD